MPSNITYISQCFFQTRFLLLWLHGIISLFICQNFMWWCLCFNLYLHNRTSKHLYKKHVIRNSDFNWKIGWKLCLIHNRLSSKTQHPSSNLFTPFISGKFSNNEKNARNSRLENKELINYFKSINKC